MIVCVCRRVSNRDIERSAQQGCTTFDELQMELGVSTCCGRCTECARAVFDSALVPASRHMTPAGAALALV